MRGPLLALALSLSAACGGRSWSIDAPKTPAEPSGPPVARTVDTVQEVFGLRVADPYRWMEGSENPERDTWMRAQGGHADAWLARIPRRGELFARISALGGEVASSSHVQLAGGRTFFFDIAAGAPLPVLKVRESDGSERVLFDPTKIESAGGHASINSYKASPDGETVACNISTGGREVSSIKLIAVDTGAMLADEIPKIWGEFAVSWLPDGKGFFYTQMAKPAPGGDPMQNMRARLHVLGKLDGDVDMVVGDKAAWKIAPQEFPIVRASPGSAWAVARGLGARPQERVAVAKLSAIDRSGGAATKWNAIADYDDEVSFAFVHGDRAYLLAFEDTPNKQLVSVPLAAPDLKKARVEVAEDPEARLTGVGSARDAFYYVTTLAGQSTLYRKPWTAKRATPIALPYPGVINAVVTDPLRDGVTFSITSWVRPAAFLAYDSKTGKLTETGLRTRSAADFSAITTQLVEATSADGTKVPLTILRPNDLVLDGSHPAIVIGYGGYGFALDPSFDATRLAWLERGGVIAYAHVRGGGEKGRRWHLAGKGANKANGVADLIACGEHLIAQGYTSGARIAVQGGSMGGLLVGMAITTRPDLFAAANIQVGALNPVRMLHAENGANQKAELGDPETEQGFGQILAMDPYQHVADGTAYPATLFTIGLNDRRVAPWMTAKMAARMLAARTSTRPVLVRIDTDAGHGVGSTRDQRFREIADAWSFFLAIAGEPGFSVPE